MSTYQTAANLVAVLPARPDYKARVALAPAVTPSLLRRLWRTDAWLTGAGLFLLALVIPSVLGIWLDPRQITGAPTWMKPTKFALSTSVYSLTLAWVFTFLHDWPRTRRIVGRATAIVMLLELAIIDLQAWRGTTSHFNVGSLFDGVLFAIMGAGIFVQTIASIAVAWALWRQHFEDVALGWALRLGMTITIVGAFTGGLMTGPTKAQLAEAQATKRLTLAGAHTVGAPDGGPGVPVTGWSTRHGDLRVPHFIGLHALQALPLFALLFFHKQQARVRTRAVLTAAAIYFLLFAATLIQALQGFPLLAAG
jgi:hypothetical protein